MLLLAQNYHGHMVSDDALPFLQTAHIDVLIIIATYDMNITFRLYFKAMFTDIDFFNNLESSKHTLLLLRGQIKRMLQTGVVIKATNFQDTIILTVGLVKISYCVNIVCTYKCIFWKRYTPYCRHAFWFSAQSENRMRSLFNRAWNSSTTIISSSNTVESVTENACWGRKRIQWGESLEIQNKQRDRDNKYQFRQIKKPKKKSKKKKFYPCYNKVTRTFQG